METEYDFSFFEEGSFSHLFSSDIEGERFGFVLNYPCTASWAIYPNNRKFLIQDGASEETKVSYEKLTQVEPWKIMSSLGDDIAGVVVEQPPEALVSYWRDFIGYGYDNILHLPRKVYCDELSRSDRIDRLITLFPFDHIAPEKHAVDPDVHYHLLSKTALAEMGVHYPHYKVFDLLAVRPEDVELQAEYPYLIKTSHGLSGEGTYIIREEGDLDLARREISAYLAQKLVQAVVVSDFVKNEVANYCVQFYVDKEGGTTLIGATNQLVTPTGEHLGGIIHYKELDMSKFYRKIAILSRFLHKHGYFGVVGVDILEDTEGQLHVIDANIRTNGSTPLCLQRYRMLEAGKEVAKYSSDYRMDTSLDEALSRLRPESEQRDVLVLSGTEIMEGGKKISRLCAVVAGEDVDELLAIENRLARKGLYAG